MKRFLAVLALCSMAGCASSESRRSEEIATRLARIEARLDDVATQFEPVQPSSKSTSVDAAPAMNPTKLVILERLALLTAELEEHRSAGFTDAYPPIGQLKEELRRLIKAASALPNHSSPSEEPR